MHHKISKNWIQSDSPEFRRILGQIQGQRKIWSSSILKKYRKLGSSIASNGAYTNFMLCNLIWFLLKKIQTGFLIALNSVAVSIFASVFWIGFDRDLPFVLVFIFNFINPFTAVDVRWGLTFVATPAPFFRLDWQ